jgi:hypothetical protein
VEIGLLDDVQMLEQSVAALLALIDKLESQFSAHGLSNLVCAAAKLWEYGLNTMLEDTVFTLLPAVENRGNRRNTIFL